MYNITELHDMKQHAVPENIMDVEFKLFGSLTAKQFGYIIAGGLIGIFFYYLFKSFGVTFLGWIFAGLSVILGFSLALIRINDQPFEVWLGNFLAAMFTSQKRVWRKGKKVPEALSNKKQGVPTQQPPVVAQKPVQQRKEQTPVAPQNQDQQQTEQQKVPSHPFKAMNTQDSSQQKQSTPAVSQGAAQTIAGKPVQQDTHFVPGSAQKAVTVTTNQQTNRPLTIPSSSVLPKSTDVDTSKQKKMSSTSEQQAVTQPTVDQSQGQTSDTQTTVSAQPSVQSTGQGITGTQPVQEAGAQPQTPNQQSASAQHINKAVQFQDVMPKKAESMQSNTQKDTLQSSSQPQDTFQEENKALRAKVAEFSEEKGKLETELTQTKKMYESLENQNKQMSQQIAQLQQSINTLKQTPSPSPQPQQSKPDVPQQPSIQQKDQNIQTPQKDTSGNVSPKIYDGPTLSKKPNVISGIVKGKDGELLPGVVVIVKTDKRPVRAMKTNSLGQFITTTALDNGKYTLELSKEGSTIGRYELELKGEPLPTYEFTTSD